MAYAENYEDISRGVFECCRKHLYWPGMYAPVVDKFRNSLLTYIQLLLYILNLEFKSCSVFSLVKHEYFLGFLHELKVCLFVFVCLCASFYFSKKVVAFDWCCQGFRCKRFQFKNTPPPTHTHTHPPPTQYDAHPDFDKITPSLHI